MAPIYRAFWVLFMQSFSKIKGVFCSGVSAGIKSKGLDLGFIYVPSCEASAGVFTTNQFKAACVTRNQTIQLSKNFKAIVINSGNANAVTGQDGEANNQRIAETAAELLSLNADQVVTASTGIIGKPLPMQKYIAGLSDMLAQAEVTHDDLVAQAIMTTDTVQKTAYSEEDCAGQVIKCAGIAKGSGMIAPNMATMLGFIVTNYPATKSELQECLKEACDYSFNLISVDGDTSTNDMVLAMSSAEEQIVRTQEAYLAFKRVLAQTCQSLAQQIIRDGEGATRLISVNIQESSSYEDAKKIALTIVNSPLVKTALHGADPNWGRVLAALGRAGVALRTELVSVSMQGVKLVAAGQPVTFDRNDLHHKLEANEVLIEIALGLGSASVTAWGCDLSRAYVDINVEYN